MAKQTADQEPDVVVKVWIDSCGLDAIVHTRVPSTGYGFSKSFRRTYNQPGQVAALWEAFRCDVLQFIDQFRKAR